MLKQDSVSLFFIWITLPSVYVTESQEIGLDSLNTFSDNVINVTHGASVTL